MFEQRIARFICFCGVSSAYSPNAVKRELLADTKDSYELDDGH